METPKAVDNPNWKKNVNERKGEIKMKTKIDIYLEPTLIKKLEAEAYRTGLSISRLIEKAIEEKYFKLMKGGSKQNGKYN